MQKTTEAKRGASSTGCYLLGTWSMSLGLALPRHYSCCSSLCVSGCMLPYCSLTTASEPEEGIWRVKSLRPWKNVTEKWNTLPEPGVRNRSSPTSCSQRMLCFQESEPARMLPCSTCHFCLSPWPWGHGRGMITWTDYPHSRQDPAKWFMRPKICLKKTMETSEQSRQEQRACAKALPHNSFFTQLCKDSVLDENRDQVVNPRRLKTKDTLW